MAKNLLYQPVYGTFRQRLFGRFVRRNHKDHLFIRLFREKRELLQLYNALNGSSYENEQDLTITTIDDVVYMGIKNDCSFIVGNYLNLYEHQSTFCPNMPIRGLFYLSGIYQGYLAEHGMNMYGTKLLRLPAPRYVVFYNGTEKRPDREELRLSSAFEAGGSCLELTVTVININYGHNQEIMEKCRTLAEYSALIEKIREYQREGKSLAAAIDAACVYCIEHDILKEFLSRPRNEVTKVLLTEYNAKKQRKMDMRDAREEGIAQGMARGIAQGEAKKIVEQVCRKLRKGKNVETIAQELEEEEALIQGICAVAEEFAPEFESGNVFEKWKQQNQETFANTFDSWRF